MHTEKQIQSLFTTKSKGAIPLVGYTIDGWEKAAKDIKKQFACRDFKGGVGQIALIEKAGKLTSVLVGLGKGENLFGWGIADKLPNGIYAISNDLDASKATHAMIAWGLSTYKFDVYKTEKTKKSVQLVIPKNADTNDAMAQISGTFLGRDLINTPANDLGPADLADVAKKMAKQFGATIDVIDVTKKQDEFPMIYAVGKGSERSPYLIDLKWGDKKGKSITLVGKGIIFDTGGYNLKPGGAMELMKKDMGGSAVALSVARMIMQSGIKGINLRVLVAAAENSVSGSAFRPSDVLQSRGGITVEIGNTDAEGRLVLGDALTYASESKPDLIMDFATLTGAARVALGTEVAAMFTHKDDIANTMAVSAGSVNDPIWRMPLVNDYMHMLENTPTADMNNVGKNAYGGAIVAGLFLDRFVDDDIPWVHFDLMGYNIRARTGRPVGGEPMVARTAFDYIKTILA